MTEMTKWLPLNTAQSRIIRNFTPDELLNWRLTTVVEIVDSLTPDQAEAALVHLAARHEALRSRLSLDPSGIIVQEVLPPQDAKSVMRWHVVAETRFDASDQRFWQEDQMDPWSHAFHATTYVVDGAVSAIKLTVSHAFTDRMGIQIIENELRGITTGDVEPAPHPQQASAYALSPSHPEVVQNTKFWRDLLSMAPRACTYAPVPRKEVEAVPCVELRLLDDFLKQIDQAASKLRTTASCIWTAAISVVAEGLSGQHRQVFKTTTANRISPEDFTVVAELAQVIFIPLDGSPDDTLRRRVELATEASFAMFERGTYDANSVLDHFNVGPGFGGMLLHPAFEWHYIPITYHPGFTTGTEPRVFEEMTRIDMPSGRSDLQVSLAHDPDPVLEIRARRPISEERSPDSLLTDLLRTIELICASPDEPVKSAGISALPSRAHLTTGHHSGAAISLVATRMLILGITGVAACDLRISDTDGRLHANLQLRAGTDRTRIMDEIRAAQMWAHGTAVPDEYVFNLI